MQLNKKERSLLGFASFLLGFLSIILLKAQGVTGRQVVIQETAVPSLIQTEQENQQLSVDNEKLQLELANAGLIGVAGPGLRITLDDSKRVQRVTSNTEVYCSGSYIQINGTRQMHLYVIDAIGDANTLSGALNFYYNWVKLGDLQQQNGYHFAEPVKEGI